MSDNHDADCLCGLPHDAPKAERVAAYEKLQGQAKDTLARWVEVMAKAMAGGDQNTTGIYLKELSQSVSNPRLVVAVLMEAVTALAANTLLIAAEMSDDDTVLAVAIGTGFDDEGKPVVTLNFGGRVSVLGVTEALDLTERIQKECNDLVRRWGDRV